jgi:hypothetical protein
MSAAPAPRSFDRYARVARLYPALLAIAPLLWSMILVYPDLVSDLRKGAASALAVGCILYLLASLTRSRGKIAETRLIKDWGASQTTILLRHRNAVIDAYTKARYHAALSALCPGLVLPTPAQEQQAPADADAIYRSATKRLIEARRGQRFQMVEDENASYGFRRNLWGLKPVALGIAALAACVTALAWWFTMPAPITASSVATSIQTYPHLSILLTLDLGYFALWASMIGPAFVSQAAREYALALFRTLEPASC